MDVTIRERMFSLSSEYDIAAESGDYNARKKILAWNDKIRLQTPDGRLVASIQGHFSPFRERHTFALADGRTFEYCCEKILKQVYRCTGSGATYRLYTHRGLKFSIFRDDRQIAAFTKNRFVIGRGNEYAVRMDADADPVVVLCMILTYSTDEEAEREGNSMFTLSLGSLGPHARPYDESWQPR